MTATPPDPAAAFKQQAAIKAASLVQDGMAVGLGTGSTAKFVVAELGRRVREEGLRIRAIPTSSVTEKQAKEEGIPLTTFGEQPELDIAIDGADEIEPRTLNLIKGLGALCCGKKLLPLPQNSLLWWPTPANTWIIWVQMPPARRGYSFWLGKRCTPVGRIGRTRHTTA